MKKSTLESDIAELPPKSPWLTHSGLSDPLRFSVIIHNVDGSISIENALEITKHMIPEFSQALMKIIGFAIRERELLKIPKEIADIFLKEMRKKHRSMEEVSKVFIKKEEEKLDFDRAQDHIRNINNDFQMGILKISERIDDKYPPDPPPDIMSLTKNFLR